MMDLAAGAAVGAFLATYLVHSTLLIAGVALVAGRIHPSRADLREAAWKVALVGGFVSSLAASLLPLPHWGHAFSLGSSARPSRFEAAVRPAREPVAPAPGPGAGRARAGGMPAPETKTSLADVLPDGRLLWAGFATAWALGGVLALLKLAVGWADLCRIEHASRTLEDGAWADAARWIVPRFGLRRPPLLFATPGDEGPMAAGMLRGRVFIPESIMGRLDDAQAEALLAHEAAHLARRDPLWATLASLLGGAFFFQPLNLLVRRRLRIESEYLADRGAIGVLGDPLPLARCLATLGEWRLGRGADAVPEAAVGVAAFRSNLGDRVARILEPTPPPSGRARWAGPLWRGLLAALVVATLVAAPRALAGIRTVPSPNPGGQPMTAPEAIRAAALATALAWSPAPLVVPAADDPPAAATQGRTLPDGIRGFSGTLVGRLVEKDVERGSLVMKVDQVKHVWKKSTASDPASVVGKVVAVDGVRNRFLDNLLTMGEGDRLEIEAFHTRGERLNFLGETLTRLADEPEADQASGFPRGLEGFRGMLVGEVVSKDDEAGTLVFRAERVSKVWKQNKAEDPESAIGWTLRVEGIRGKFLDTLLVLKPGDTVEVEAFHNRGEQLDFVGEWLRKLED